MQEYYGYPPPVQPRGWFEPTPSGVRYDHLGRNAVNEWWRPLVGLLMVGGSFFIVGLFVVVVGVAVASVLGISAPLTQQQLFGDPAYGLVVVLLSIALVLPFVFGTAALIQKRRPGTLSSVAGRLRWSWLWQCVAVAVVALILGQAALYVAYVVAGEDTAEMFGAWAGWGQFVPGMVVVLLLVPFQAATEEYLFRGFFIQAFGCWIKSPWPGIVLGSASFMLMHGYTDAGMVDVFAFGVVMGWLAVRTGGLEAPIALHVMNNIVAFGLSAYSGDLEEALVQGSVPWPALAGTLVQLGVFTAGVLFLAKKRSLRAISA